MDTFELNREIHKWEENPCQETIIEVAKIQNYTIKYIKCHELKPGECNVYIQKDMLQIYKDNNLICTHKPHLDTHISINENIICMSSDGEYWIYDLNKEKEVTIEHSIVAFNHPPPPPGLEGRYKIDNTFIIYGTGCYWGFESEEYSFEIYINKDTLEEEYYWDNDGYDDLDLDFDD